MIVIELGGLDEGAIEDGGGERAIALGMSVSGVHGA